MHGRIIQLNTEKLDRDEWADNTDTIFDQMKVLDYADYVTVFLPESQHADDVENMKVLGMLFEGFKVNTKARTLTVPAKCWSKASKEMSKRCQKSLFAFLQDDKKVYDARAWSHLNWEIKDILKWDASYYICIGDDGWTMTLADFLDNYCNKDSEQTFYIEYVYDYHC